jgi:hypothetical protein
MNTPMKRVEPSATHLAFRKALEDCMRKHVGEMPAEEVLAVLSYTVGQLCALQDQRKFTGQMLMDLVATNIEQGNASVIEGLMNAAPGGSA